MTRRISARVTRLENRFGGSKDHIKFAEDEDEIKAIEAWWRDSPYSKRPGHKLIIVTSNMPKKDPNL